MAEILRGAKEQTSRQLVNTEIDCLENLFPSILEESKMLLALKVNSIQPNKLMKLSIGNKQSLAPKLQDKFGINPSDAGEI